MNNDVVLVEVSDGVATVTLNRPKVMNAMSSALRRQLAAAFAGLENRADVQAIILTGAGRAFCAGLDLAELEQVGLRGVDLGPENNVVARMNALSQPIIGAVNGFAVTGGLELALACDFLIASSEAQFADTHVRVGVIPGWGMSQKLPRLIGINRAKEMSLTGRLVDAELAHEWGLVNRIVSPDELLSVCHELAAEIAKSHTPTLHAVKQLIDEGWAQTLEVGMRLEGDLAESKRDSVDLEALSERRHRTQDLNRSQLNNK